jgi:hypothetical protein
MTTRSARLWGPIPVADGAGSILATVPDGERWIVKSYRFVNTIEDQVLVSMCLDSLTAATALHWLTRVGQRGLTISTLWEVFHAGEDILAVADVAGALVAWGSGARLPV